jgi:hypothetical protein
MEETNWSELLLCLLKNKFDGLELEKTRFQGICEKNRFVNNYYCNFYSSRLLLNVEGFQHLYHTLLLEK